MANYDYDNTRPQSRDIILASNEFVFIQNKTNGSIKTYTGPTTATISAQEALVTFNEKSKSFCEATNFDAAKQLCKVIPENWYAVLKNPAKNRTYPESGTSTVTPELDVGKKINVRGPASFALHPGQMARVIRGHALRSNQYLLARVYEADSANNSQAEVYDANGQKVAQDNTKYVNGQMLIIAGTDVSFYIPSDGIEVIAVENNERLGYIREALTLERLEYCILKDENGEKRYIHGPAVVFPKPSESFVTSSNGAPIFKATELSPISGIYIKVIAAYDDNIVEDSDGNAISKVHHPIGEEMFITGNDQMIYYPRPEHAIINYDGKIIHYAIAIPEGEGRYIMNRLTGEIRTVKGPSMYLPDPRTEVVVKRKLTEKQCRLWYPGNGDVLNYNNALNEKAVEKSTSKNGTNSSMMSFATAAMCSTTSLDALEAKANISRGTSYTKPRTITIDSKMDGAVSIDVWTGYAVNVVAKDGTRRVVKGPQTVLLDYDETLETFIGQNGQEEVYLHYENNRIGDLVSVVTKDMVNAKVSVLYNVSFEPTMVDKWFNIDSFIKKLTNHSAGVIRQLAKNYTIEEFYQNYADIISKTFRCNECLIKTEGERKVKGYLFPENGMCITHCEVNTIQVEAEIGKMLDKHQKEMVNMALKLSYAEKQVGVIEKLLAAEDKEQELRHTQQQNRLELEQEARITEFNNDAELARMREAERVATVKAKNDLIPLEDAIAAAARERTRLDAEQQNTIDNERLNLDKIKKETYAKTIASIMTAVSPDLIAAMTTNANADLAKALADSMAPYALANGESVSDVAVKLLKGTPVERLLQQMTIKG